MELVVGGRKRNVKRSLEVKLCSQAYLHAFGSCRRRHAGLGFAWGVFVGDATACLLLRMETHGGEINGTTKQAALTQFPEEERCWIIDKD